MTAPTTTRPQRPTALGRTTAPRSASPRAVRLRDLPRAEQARFAMALQRSRAAAPGSASSRSAASVATAA